MDSNLFSHISVTFRAVWLGLLFIATGSATFAQQEPDSPDKDYSAELPRIDPLSADEELASFEIATGYRIELVAAEPLVFDPVAFAFDAQERLFVVEMRDYSEQATEHLGSIALLSDTDGDGRMDERSTFVEGLSWPTAIWPWKDGVLVAEPPRITWYRDTDGDGVSDASEDWFTGFERSNVQGLVNSLRWGVDGYLHGATSSSGADVEQLSSDGASVSLRRRDFRIDPLTRTLQPTTGGGQHGLSFNSWGDKFVTSNSDHLQQVIDLENWLADQETAVPLPELRRSIAEDGPQAEVFRASPVEPWRLVRTRLRVSGVAPGIVEGGGRAAGYFTGATGTWIMDRQAGFGEPDTDTALVCDVGSNLVHRKRLLDHGIFFAGQRIDPQTEFLRSSDTWFRPVQLGDGPDGALYIADMYREVIEHPKSLPPMIKKHLDLTSGRDRGRIWRVVAESSPDSQQPPLAALESRQLVEELQSSIAWRRRMASQLLIERQPVALLQELTQVAVDSAAPQAQVLATHLIGRLGQFSPELARQLLGALHERVVQHALQLVHHYAFARELEPELLQLAASQSPRVQLELARLSELLPPPSAARMRESLLRNVQDPLVRSVAATAAGSSSWPLFIRISSDLPDEQLYGWLDLLLPVWIKEWEDNATLREGLRAAMLSSEPRLRIVWQRALAQSLSSREVALVWESLDAAQQDVLNQQVEQQLSAAAEDSAMKMNLALLRLLPVERRLAWAQELLEPTRREAAQRAVIDLTTWANDEALAELVISRFSSLTPGLQAELLRGLSDRPPTARLLLEAIQQDRIRAPQVPPDVREKLTSLRDLGEQFRTLLGTASADRQSVIDRYAQSLDGGRDPDMVVGGEVFQKSCAQCHQLGDVGNDVGPPLKQLSDKSPQQLLEIVLDPNREVDPKYMSYTVLLEDGRVLAGIIKDESAGQIVLKEAGGKQHSIARVEIEQLKSSGISLMPEGLEEQISAAQMADLIGYLKTQAAASE